MMKSVFKFLKAFLRDPHSLNIYKRIFFCGNIAALIIVIICQTFGKIVSNIQQFIEEIFTKQNLENIFGKILEIFHLKDKILNFQKNFDIFCNEIFWGKNYTNSVFIGCLETFGLREKQRAKLFDESDKEPFDIQREICRILEIKEQHIDLLTGERTEKDAGSLDEPYFDDDYESEPDLIEIITVEEPLLSIEFPKVPDFFLEIDQFVNHSANVVSSFYLVKLFEITEVFVSGGFENLALQTDHFFANFFYVCALFLAVLGTILHLLVSAYFYFKYFEIFKEIVSVKVLDLSPLTPGTYYIIGILIFLWIFRMLYIFLKKYFKN